MANQKGIFKIREDTYQIREYWMGIANVYMYLIVGSKKALMIDSGYSDTDAIKYVRSVTDKPVILVNTHGHMDHCGGNGDFKEAYISDKDLPVYKQFAEGDYTKNLLNHVLDVNHIPKLLRKLPIIQNAIKAAIYMKPCKFLSLPESGYFDLGDRRVFFRETPGHTVGSICLADEKTGILFTGDNLLTGGLLLAFDHSTTVGIYRDSLVSMKEMCECHHLKTLYPSHHEVPLPLSRIDDFIELCDRIMSGQVKGSYVDKGTNQGLETEYNGISIIYRKV